MTYQHARLASGKWSTYHFFDQMGNVGSEVERTLVWKNKNHEYSMAAFHRALELIQLTIDQTNSSSKLRELTRLREAFADYVIGDNLYSSTDEQWRNYFFAFSVAAQLRRSM